MGSHSKNSNLRFRGQALQARNSPVLVCLRTPQVRPRSRCRISVHKIPCLVKQAARVSVSPSKKLVNKPLSQQTSSCLSQRKKPRMWQSLESVVGSPQTIWLVSSIPCLKVTTIQSPEWQKLKPSRPKHRR